MKDTIKITGIGILVFAMTTFAFWWGGYNFTRGARGLEWIVSSFIFSTVAVLVASIIFEKI